MKQGALLRWIEVAEHARFCLLAEERAERAPIDPTPTRTQPRKSLLDNLREQLCLIHVIDRLPRFGGLGPAG